MTTIPPIMLKKLVTGSVINDDVGTLAKANPARTHAKYNKVNRSDIKIPPYPCHHNVCDKEELRLRY